MSRPLPDKFLVAFSFAGEQRDLVRALAEAVEQKLGHGTVFFDEWFPAFVGGHDADLRLQGIYQDRCHLAIVCASAQYGAKEWPLVEHEVIRARVMAARGAKSSNEQFGVLPIRVGDGEVPGIPDNVIAHDVRKLLLPASVELIVARLHLAAPHLAPAPVVITDWPATPATLPWDMADHHEVRDAVAQLLTCTSTKRYLPLRGASECGKSHITRLIHAHALAQSDLACGRFDFKGTNSMDNEIRSFITALHVPEPPAGRPLNERLAHILNSLIANQRPTLLILDTYEQVGEARDWVEKQLLLSLVRQPWLRVIIAGQQVPATIGTAWTSCSCPLIQLKPPTPEHWFEFSRPYKPEFDFDFVQKCYACCGGSAALLSQMLGPRT